jgi:hypothetical protein
MTFTTILFIVVCIAIMAAKTKKAVKKAFPVSPVSDDASTFEDENNQGGHDVESSGSGYFSYENIPGNTCFSENNPSTGKLENDAVGRLVAEQETVLQAFDLRQAVIYDTILHNDYIDFRR